MKEKKKGRETVLNQETKEIRTAHSLQNPGLNPRLKGRIAVKNIIAVSGKI